MFGFPDQKIKPFRMTQSKDFKREDQQYFAKAITLISFAKQYMWSKNYWRSTSSIIINASKSNTACQWLIGILLSVWQHWSIVSI
jgi:hypothetical protein